MEVVGDLAGDKELGMSLRDENQIRNFCIHDPFAIILRCQLDGREREVLTMVQSATMYIHKRGNFKLYPTIIHSTAETIA